jgi:hypothetical protein
MFPREHFVLAIMYVPQRTGWLHTIEEQGLAGGGCGFYASAQTGLGYTRHGERAETPVATLICLARRLFDL